MSVVTLEVDPVQAEHLAYSAHEGRLQLAMRAPGDDEEIRTTSVGVIDVLGKKRVKRAKTRTAGASVQVLNGTQLQTRHF